LAVKLGRVVVGVMLCQMDGDALRVEVNVVAPELRGGWANLLMVEAMARRARTAGSTPFRFGCKPHVTDTLGLTWRSGAVPMVEQLEMSRGLSDQ